MSAEYEYPEPTPEEREAMEIAQAEIDDAKWKADMDAWNADRKRRGRPQWRLHR